MIRSLATFLMTLAMVKAACDNQCSGHGNCMVDDVCQCFDNWGVGLSRDSGDCSDRICPFEFAWVDNPGSDGRFHTYAECSGRGVCDRKTGLCDCFDGYEGKACKRTTCPNDCSGHGTCEYIEDLPFGVVWDGYHQAPDLGWNWDNTVHEFFTDPATRNYFGWDKGKIRGCKCDPQYADVDCSKRMCPHGTDVLDIKENLLMSEKSQIQSIAFKNASEYNNGETFALKFVSRLNETFVTYPIAFDYFGGEDFRIDIHLALLSLPNKVIDACTVSAEKVNGNNDVVVNITFTGDAVQGPQNKLEVLTKKCDVGCTPKLTGLTNLATSVNGYAYEIQYYNDVNEKQRSDLNSYECGRRGKCDYSSGLCECFEGYTGENCNTQTTLV